MSKYKPYLVEYRMRSIDVLAFMVYYENSDINNRLPRCVTFLYANSFVDTSLLVVQYCLQNCFFSNFNTDIVSTATISLFTG